ncbi:hypothetical protein JHK86_026620 [Glycine max]|nr:hypothetical protein JHK86_026620 [Glycine max]
MNAAALAFAVTEPVLRKFTSKGYIPHLTKSRCDPIFVGSVNLKRALRAFSFASIIPFF